MVTKERPGYNEISLENRGLARPDRFEERDASIPRELESRVSPLRPLRSCSRQMIEGFVSEAVNVPFSMLGHIDDAQREFLPRRLGLTP
jgi:hypothetical protein